MNYIHIYFLIFFSFISCKEKEFPYDFGNNQNLNPDQEQELIQISNPYPCIDEEITLFYFIQGDSKAIWTIDGEIINNTKEITKTFTEDGIYPVKLEVTNDKGVEIRSSAEIHVMGEKISVELARLARSDEFWICAHRANTLKGLTDGANMAPENSIKAIEMAIEKEVKMIELDIRVTSDKEFVIMHDMSVNRTTDGTGNVSNLSLAQVKGLFLKDNADRVTEHRVPTLKEALEAGRGKVYYNIDMGGMLSEGWTLDDTKRLVKLIEETSMLHRSVFYIGSNQNVGNDLYAANNNILLFPWISTMGNLSDWAIAKVIQLAPTTDVNIINAALARDVPSFSNHLTADDEALRNHGDYSKLDNLVNKKIKIIQTDYAELVDAYVN